MVKWLDLISVESLPSIIDKNEFLVIFKHSTRCSVSGMAKRSFEHTWVDLPTLDIPCFYVDVIAYRDVSNTIAQLFMVEHQSPQLLLIQNGKCILYQSHSDIDAEEVFNSLQH